MANEVKCDYTQEVQDEVSARFKSRYPKGEISFIGREIMFKLLPDSKHVFAFRSLEAFNRWW